MDKTVSTKIKQESLRKLKAIAALRQETMLSVLERVLSVELEQFLKKEQKAK